MNCFKVTKSTRLYAGMLMLLAVPVSVAVGQDIHGKRVRVVTQPAGDHYEVTVENLNPFDITLTLTLTGQNFTSSRSTPLKEVYKPQTKTVALQVYRESNDKPFKVRTGYTWFLGDVNAQHNDSYIYALPYRRGESYRLGQGPEGKYSHSGTSKHALDFMMPEGTAVCAAREGVVINAKDDSDRGGPSERFMNDSNFIVIRHNDGTLGEYAHLRKNGVMVEVGQYVRKGEKIGESGNTGYSSGPHLHFMVTKTMEDGTMHSIPFRFRDSDGIVTYPREGEFYTAD